MIVLVVVIAVALIGLGATYVFEHRGKAKARKLAERGRVEGGRADGIDTPIAAEGLLRGGYPPDSSGGGFS